MKLLKVENSQGWYLDAEGTYAPIDRISKDDILRLADNVLAGEVELDDFDEDSLRNQSHHIIYKSVKEKLDELSTRRVEFQDECKRLYRKEYERYRSDVTDSQA